MAGMTCSCSSARSGWGGFSPEAMRFLGELSQARNDGIDLERASATWSDVVGHLLPRPATLAVAVHL